MQGADPFVSAHKWINHLSLWCMASGTSDLRLPCQLWAITTLQLTNSPAGDWDTYVCEWLAQGCYLKAEWLGDMVDVVKENMTSLGLPRENAQEQLQEENFIEKLDPNSKIGW